MLCLCVSLAALVLPHYAAAQYNCSAALQRTPVNDDMTVVCGPQFITMTVNLCTALYAGFDPTGLAVNSRQNDSQCKGLIDSTVTPPVIRYSLPVNGTLDNICSNSIQIVNEGAGTGFLSSFSNIQSVVISGYIDTRQSSSGLISYSTDLYYGFSCRYPLEYILNNTQIITSSVSVAVNGNNGTFISTLSMKLYNDSSYTYPLSVPETGIPLKTKVFVQVRASNLTASFHVLLDHCFATPDPFNMTLTERHDFFIGCSKDNQTTIIQNGDGLTSQFRFDAFRFLQHRDRKVSSIYLHCVTRLCQPSTCKELKAACTNTTRRRRDAETQPLGSAETVTVSAGPIFTKELDTLGEISAQQSVYHETLQETLTGLVVGVVFAVLLAVAAVLGGWFMFKKYHVGARKPGLEGYPNQGFN
ncbi:zona pellucida-like domain-containing protein 1 [Acipenser ruthenus]|uniref:zona pellucida-like domain-containing protein 1 n=1 Tax=Acipenser ruthenus TaxID=7906 RepID=UPI0027428B03|nr:zona pellucida-like domain-containing protein 1 [Acipenser ruthenus]XP_058865817.1 zona pellucida-like domain-containing protein 1 [Acipenser ruthenus]